MKQLRLGNTDLICSMLCLGTWGLGGRNTVSGTAAGWQDITNTQARNTISAALDAGINFFDSSDFYGLGAAEELLGDTIPKSDTRIVIATKVGIIPSLVPGTTKLDRNFSPEYIEAALNASLTRLRREYIDLYQLHGPSLKALPDETWSALERLKASGKIRYIGVSLKSSGFNSADFNLLIRNPLISSIQTRYNFIHIQQANFIDSVKADDIAVLARSIFQHGFLTGKYSSLREFSKDDHRSEKFSEELMIKVGSFLQQARSVIGEDVSACEIPLRYALSSPNITVGIIGATSPEQIRENTEASEKPVLTEEQRLRIGSIAETIFSPSDH